MELRETIRELIAEKYDEWANGESYDLGMMTDAAADAILAIPEIRDALELSGAFPENDFRDYLLRRGRWEGVSSGAGYV